jgi:hypothetical protein
MALESHTRPDVTRPMLASRTVEIIAILVVLVGGFSFLAVRRYWIDQRDSAFTEAAGGEWRLRSELPLDAGPPYSDFGAELLLTGPSDVMEGTDEGFEVAFFMTYENGVSNSRAEWPGAIVQLSVETPKFRFVAEDLDERAPRRLNALRRETPPHYDTGRPGRVGPATAELLSGARSVIVTTAPFALWVQSRGAQSRAVNGLAIALAKALVADARAATPDASGV